MNSNYERISIHDVSQALEPLKSIPRPPGNNEGDPIDSPGVFKKLAPDHQELVNHAKIVTAEYVRKPGDMGSEPNRRAITELNKKGYSASLDQEQYDPMRLVGSVEVGDWTLTLSDPPDEPAED